jgi:peptidoglycan/xylan/chitin deacetylase (PgdA/CDA1 family)
MIRLTTGFVIALHEFPPARLAELMEHLRPAQPVPLTELVERRKRGRSNAGLFAITVDDGVGDNVRSLAALFRARQWPATFYLPTSYLDTGRAMAFQWWWRLVPLLPRRRLDLPSGVIDLSRPGAVEELTRKMERMWHSRRLDVYLPFTLDLADAVARDLGISRTELEGPAPISWPEVEQLSRDPLLQFESHGESHGAMSEMTEEEIAFEMLHSRDTIEEHTGRACRHLCYPFGTALAIGSVAPRLARRYYDSAVTMRLGAFDTADPWLAPRIPLYPQNSLLFARIKVVLNCTRIGRLRAPKRSESEPACLPKPGLPKL